jgi:hypothetical protein
MSVFFVLDEVAGDEAAGDGDGDGFGFAAFAKGATRPASMIAERDVMRIRRGPKANGSR